MTPLAARADVTTPKAERYAKQLVNHLGHKLAFTTTGPESVAGIGAGTGTVIAGDGVLTLLASAPNADDLDAIKHVLGTHLERFGGRDGLTVAWSQ